MRTGSIYKLLMARSKMRRGSIMIPKLATLRSKVRAAFTARTARGQPLSRNRVGGLSSQKALWHTRVLLFFVPMGLVGLHKIIKPHRTIDGLACMFVRRGEPLSTLTEQLTQHLDKMDS